MTWTRNPFQVGTPEFEYEEQRLNERRAEQTSNGTPFGTLPTGSVPNPDPAQQAKGHKDTRDIGRQETTEQAEEKIAHERARRLLGAIRDGAWLDAQDFPALRYAVPGLVPEGFTVLVGPPKVGKSWLIGALLLAIAAGGMALGRIHVGDARRVLYLALEDGDRRMQSRCRKLLGAGASLPALFHYVTRVAPGEVHETIAAFLDRYPDTAMVVIDTLGKVMPPAGPNETTYQRDYRVGGRIKEIADRRPGLAVVAIHHDRKAGSDDFVERVSGTNGLAGSADTVMVLGRKRQSTEGLLMVTGRDVPEAEYALLMVDGVSWTLDGADLAEAAARAQQRDDSERGRISDTSADIIEYVRQNQPVTTRQVKDKHGDDAGRYLSRLTDSGRLVRIGRGQYGTPTNTVPSVPLSFSQVSGDAERDTVATSVPNGERATP